MIVNTNSLLCSVLSLISILLTSFILALSTVRTTVKANLGPKIFVVNLMIVDLVNSLCAFFNSSQAAFPDTVVIWVLKIFGREPNVEDQDAWWWATEVTQFIKDLTLAVFTCSMVPMTVMSILACYRPKAFTGNTAAKYFAVLVILTDVVPIIFALIHATFVDFEEMVLLYLTRSSAFPVFYFVLYCSDLLLTATAVLTLYAKTSQLTSASTVCFAVHGEGSAVAIAARRNLRRLLLFAAAPSLIQIPYALHQLSVILSEGSREGLWHYLRIHVYMAVNIVFAAKPSIDAMSTLLFLGEYRKNGAAVLRRLRWCCEEVLPSTQATVDHMGASNPISTISPMPNSFSSPQFTSSV